MCKSKARELIQKNKQQRKSFEHLIAFSLTTNTNLCFEFQTRSTILKLTSLSAVPQTSIVSAFAHLLLYLPLRICHYIQPYVFAIILTFEYLLLYLPLHAAVYPWSIVIIQSVFDYLAIYPWSICHCIICLQPILGLYMTDLRVTKSEIFLFTMSITLRLRWQ